MSGKGAGGREGEGRRGKKPLENGPAYGASIGKPYFYAQPSYHYSRCAPHLPPSPPLPSLAQSLCLTPAFPILRSFLPPAASFPLTASVPAPGRRLLRAKWRGKTTPGTVRKFLPPTRLP